MNYSKRIREYLGANQMLKNILTMMSGTIVAQFVAILITPLLSRLYTPDDFGVLALYTSLCGIGVIFSTGNYELCILLPKKDYSAFHVVCMAGIISLAFCTISCLGILLFHDEIIRLLNNNQFVFLIYLVPVGVLINALANLLNYWCNRHKFYELSSMTTITRSAVTSGLNLIMGEWQIFTGGLVLGSFLGSFSGLIRLLHYFLNTTKTFQCSVKFMWFLAKKYRKFPFFNMWATQLNNVSASLPILLLGGYFSPFVVGFYSMANRCVSLPMSVIGGSVANVYLQQCAEFSHDKKKIADMTNAVFQKLIKIAVIPFTVILGFGDYIFAFVFGDFWKVAGTYASILAPWLALVFVCSPLSSLMIVLQKQRQNFIFQFTICILRAMVLIISGIFFMDAMIAVILYSFIGFIMWFGLLLYILKCIGIRYRSTLYTLFIYMIIPFLLIRIGRLFILG